MDDTTRHAVVVNHEEQYSIWPDDRPCPPGWARTGFSGSKSDCLEHIDRVWTDMRPLSLRNASATAGPTTADQDRS